MTAEQKFLVELIASLLNKDKKIESLPSKIDARTLYNLSETHAVTVMLYYALTPIKDRINPKFYEYLSKVTLKEISSHVKKQEDVSRLTKEFIKRNLKFMPLKGYFLKAYYPLPEMRYASDFDILVENDKIPEIKTLMKDLGYTQNYEDVKHVTFINQAVGSAYELHKSIFTGELKKRFGVGFERAIPVKEGESFYKLNVEDFYVSFLAHAAVHFSENAGVGIRTIIDVYVYKNAHKDMNSEYLDALLSKCGLLEFKAQLERLADYMFGNGEGDEFIEKLADYIMECSMLEHKENFAANKIIKAEQSGKSLKKSKRKAVWQKIFPTYEQMCYNFPSVKKCKLLLPFAYVFRWFKVLFTRPKSIGQIKKINNVEQGVLDNLREIQLGLGIKDVSMFEED